MYGHGTAGIALPYRQDLGCMLGPNWRPEQEPQHVAFQNSIAGFECHMAAFALSPAKVSDFTVIGQDAAGYD